MWHQSHVARVTVRPTLRVSLTMQISVCERGSAIFFSVEGKRQGMLLAESVSKEVPCPTFGSIRSKEPESPHCVI